jgi:lipopolysaccharide biosynthesis protein
LFFDTYEPQIIIKLEGNTASNIKICGEIYYISFEDIEFFNKRLNSPMPSLQIKYYIYFWFFIRQNKALYLASKILKYKKKYGIIETLKKGTSYIHKKTKNTLQSIYKNSLLYECEYQKNIDFSGYTPQVKAIAFYLPQFHCIPENDEWWGKNFTEWTNTKKAMPRFKAHYQPREPHDDYGYYNLTNIDILVKQTALAKQHGIYGFCFYYYWFSGKRLLEKPLDLFIQHPEIDINFCLCWANESWTRRWDGRNKDILIEQEYLDDDPDNFILEIKKYVMDKRYIRIGGIPIILVYNPSDVNNIKDVFIKWRKQAERIGIGRINIFTCNTNGYTAETLNLEDSVDGMVEFPPHNLPRNLVENDVNFTGKKDGLTAHIYDYKELVSEIKKDLIIRRKKKKINVIPEYRTCILGWDNTARKKDNFCTFAGFSLKSFYEWVSIISAESEKYSAPFIFVNAWNEWSEGTYLEPDKKYGYAWINTFSKAICGLPLHNRSPIEQKDTKRINSNLIENGEINICVQVHLYYMELIDEIIKHLNYIPFPFHCYISTDTDEKVKIIENIFNKKCKNANKVYVERFENRGRDVAPFVEQMKKYINKYEFILHIHSKKSLKNLDKHGNNWRKYLYKHLLGSTDNIYRIFNDFMSDKNLGLVFSVYPPIKPFMLWAGGTYSQQGTENVINFLKRLGIEMNFGEKPYFPAGNMFWARTKSIEKVFNSNINKNDFPDENGQKDLTIAHAIERSWVYIVQNQGYSFKEIS